MWTHYRGTTFQLSGQLQDNGIVQNIIDWDGESQWSVPEGLSMVQVSNNIYMGIGSIYSNGTFGPPPQIIQ